jgi:hypothetical protein
VDAHDLTERVDSRVGSSGPHTRHFRAENFGERALDVALDGTDVGLAREAVEGCPVVREVDAEVQLRRFS